MKEFILVYGIYSCASLLIYYFVKKRYNRVNGLLFDKFPKLSFISICLISGIYTWINWFSTIIISNGVLGSDRLNYSIEFSGYRSALSDGLEFIFDMVHFIGGDIYVVLYFTTFISVFITLTAYRKSRLATPKVLLLIMLSEYIFFTFTGLKQAYSSAFACLFFVYAIEDQSKSATIKCLILIILSVLFHSSGFVLIPFMFLLRMKNTEERKYLVICLLSFVVVFFLPQILMVISKMAESAFPILTYKINKYFTEANNTLDNQWSAVFKYIPYFYVAVCAFFNRRVISTRVNQFGKLHLISIISSIIVFYSVFSYWFQRFRFVFIFPVFVLYGIIEQNEGLIGNRLINNSVVEGGTLVVTMRKIALIFINYGAF